MSTPEATLILAGGRIRYSRCQTLGGGGATQSGGGCAAGGGGVINALLRCFQVHIDMH
jgi:hypothetical protein